MDIARIEKPHSAVHQAAAPTPYAVTIASVWAALMLLAALASLIG